MTNKVGFLLVVIMASLTLNACGNEIESGSVNAAGVVEQEPLQAAGQQEAAEASDAIPLTEDYPGALSIDQQLALGTLQLEDTEHALSETQAADLLTLWQAYQSLSSSDTTASAELEAVLDQIQRQMTADQLAAIAEMRLTSDSVTALVEEGVISLGRGGFGRTNGEERGEGLAGGFLRGAGPGQGPGGGPGAEIPGGGPGGGIGNLSEDDIATRQSQFSEGTFGEMQGRLFSNMVIRLLQEKTGQLTEPTGIMAALLDTIAAETGMTVEELNGKLAGGARLSTIIEESGLNKTSLIEKLTEELAGYDSIEEQDLVEFLDRLLE